MRPKVRPVTEFRGAGVQDEWQRLDAVVAVLTGATTWPLVCEGLQGVLAPLARVYRLSHRGRKLTTGRAGGGFWISHEPRLRQAMAEMAPVHLPEGPCAGWWIPWSAGALHLAEHLVLPPRWLLTVAHLLSQFQRLPVASPAHGEDVKALRQLNELGWIIHSTPDLATLLRELPGHLGRHLALSHCAVVRLDGEQGQGTVVGGWESGVSQPSWLALTFARHSPLGEVLWDVPAGRWQPAMVGPDWHSARADELLAHGDVLMAPLRAFDGRWGLLVVRHPRPRSQRLARLLGATADHVALALAIRARAARSEQRRRQAETLFHVAPAALAVLDGAGGILESNGAAQSMLDTKLSPHTPFYQLLAAPDRQRVRDAWLDLENGKPVPIPSVALLPATAGGPIRQVACHLAPVPAETLREPLSRAVLSLCDHSVLIEQRRQLSAEVSLWEGLGAGLPVRFAIVDATHHLIGTNGPDGETMGCCSPLFQDPAGGVCLALQALQQGVTRRLPHGTIGAAGAPTLVWPVRDVDRTIIGVVAMAGAVDVVEGGESQPPATPADSAGWAVMGRLFDAVRHDLLNPLGVISGRVGALRLDGLESPHFDPIDRAVDRQVGILRTLASWRPQAGTPEPVDLVDVAQNVLQGLGQIAQAVAQGWTVVATDSPLMVLAPLAAVQALLTAIILLPGHARGRRQIRLVCHGEPGWVCLMVDGTDALPVLASEGQDLLACLGGHTLAGDPSPTWRVPRWLG
jgi:signal transduction histidine kinase